MTKKSNTTNLPGARANVQPNAGLVHAGKRYYRYDANGNIIAKKDGTTGYLESDGLLVIHNPSAEVKETVFYDKNGKTFERFVHYSKEMTRVKRKR